MLLRQISYCSITQLLECRHAVGGWHRLRCGIIPGPCPLFPRIRVSGRCVWERDTARNDFKSLVLDLRQRFVDCSQIPDVFDYLEGIESYQCLAYVTQVVQSIRVAVCPAPKSLPLIDTSTNGTNLLPSVIRSGLRGVQSYVLQHIFLSCDFMTVECLKELKLNLPNGPQFLICGSFNLWAGVSRHSSEEIFSNLFECYTAYYSGGMEDTDVVWCCRAFGLYCWSCPCWL